MALPVRILWGLVLGLALMTAAMTVAWAVLPEERLSDPVLEARAQALSRELRCVVCQNQTIDDSDAPLARDLRHLVRVRVQAGDSDAQVLDYIVARYGDFVLLRPPFSWATVALWLGPAVILILGAGVLWRDWGRRTRAMAAPKDLTPEEAKRLAALLQGSPVVREQDVAPDQDRPMEPRP